LKQNLCVFKVAEGGGQSADVIEINDYVNFCKAMLRVGLSEAKRAVKVFLALEVVGAAGLFYFYRKINRDRDFRRLMHEGNDGSRRLLDTYYKLGESMNEEHRAIREADYAAWGVSLEQNESQRQTQ